MRIAENINFCRSNKLVRTNMHNMKYTAPFLPKSNMLKGHRIKKYQSVLIENIISGRLIYCQHPAMLAYATGFPGGPVYVF